MTNIDDDPNLLAAEYALGCLDTGDMRVAEAYAARHPHFKAEMEYWEETLSPLRALVPPVAPPAEVWTRLSLAAGIPSVGVMPVVAARRTGRGFWQGATAVSLAIAAGLALFAFLPQQPGGSIDPARYTAALAPLANPAKFTAETRADGSISVTSLDNSPAPNGRAYQLWSLPQGASAPVSLGLLSPGTRLVTPAGRASPQEQLLVSDEPAGGSPTGGPTGQVLFGGKLVPVTPAPARGR